MDESETTRTANAEISIDCHKESTSWDTLDPGASEKYVLVFASLGQSFRYVVANRVVS